MTGWWFIAAGVAFCFSGSKAARIGGALLSGGGCLMIDDIMLVWWFILAALVSLSVIYDALPTGSRPRRDQFVEKPPGPLGDEVAEQR